MNAAHPLVRSSSWPARAVALSLALVGSTATIVACQTATARQGSSRVLAAYRFGTLEADLPDRTRPQAVLSAAEDALRHRGYAVRASRSTADEGKVDAAAPSGSVFEGGASVTAHIGTYGTRVGVHVGTLGDENESRAILDDILARLGL